MEFDHNKVYLYLKDNLTGFKCSCYDKFSIRKFSKGLSNPPYLIETEEQKYVLCKEPSDVIPRGSESKLQQMLNEFQIISALYSVNFPVPRPFLLCTDPQVIGIMFYIVEYVNGRTFTKDTLVHVPSEELKLMYKSLIDTLVHLHNIDWRKLNLDGYGGRSQKSYCERQISVWTNNYHMLCIDNVSTNEMERLIEWLPENIPPGPHPISIIHGDYNIFNVIFHHTEPKVIAVIDWEWHALGHPLVDIAHMCIVQQVVSTIINNSINCPENCDLTKWYFFKSDHYYPENVWLFIQVLSYFRAASMIDQVSIIFTLSINGTKFSSAKVISFTQLKPLVPLLAKEGYKNII